MTVAAFHRLHNGKGAGVRVIRFVLRQFHKRGLVAAAVELLDLIGLVDGENDEGGHEQSEAAGEDGEHDAPDGGGPVAGL